MKRVITYELTGVFEDEKTIKLDSRVLVPPKGPVKVQVMIPEGSEGSAEERRQARLRVWDAFMATPVSEEAKRFWEDLAREQRELRRRGPPPRNACERGHLGHKRRGRSDGQASPSLHKGPVLPFSREQAPPLSGGLV